MDHDDVVIVSAVRTPVGKFQGCAGQFFRPPNWAPLPLEKQFALCRAGVDPKKVDECIMGSTCFRLASAEGASASGSALWGTLG